jgi:hypothetical protein
LTSASLQEAKKKYIMAILFAPKWEPANKMFSSPAQRSYHVLNGIIIQMDSAIFKEGIYHWQLLE